jgi:hypothetical protein
MKVSLVALTVFLFLALCLGSPLEAAQLLENGGFERGNNSGWKVSRGTLSIVASYARSGSYVAKLTSDQTSWIYQVVPVKGGETYTFSGWALKEEGNSSLFLRISWYASPDGSGEELEARKSTALTIADGQFHRLSLSAPAPSEAKTALFKAVMTVAPLERTSAYFDDLSLEGPAAGMGRLRGVVRLQGRRDSGGVEVGVAGNRATSDEAGNFSLELPSGTYSLTASMPGYLEAQKPNLTLAEGDDLALPPVVLIAGDVNDDGSIDLLDLVTAAASFNTAPQDGRADLNSDGRVNIEDLVLIGMNFGKVESLWDGEAIAQ